MLRSGGCSLVARLVLTQLIDSSLRLLRSFRRHGLGELGSRLARILPKNDVFSVSLEFAYYHRNKLGCRLVALSAKIGLFGGAFINNLRLQNCPRSSVNTGIVLQKLKKCIFRQPSRRANVNLRKTKSRKLLNLRLLKWWE